MRNILSLILLTIVVFNLAKLQASEYEHSTKNYITNNSINNYGAALSMAASSIDCTMSTQRLQMGVGIGVYNDNTALVIGGCKRFNDVLLKISGGKDGDDTAYNASVMFTLN